MRVRWAGWPSTIKTTLRPRLSLTRRLRKSRNSAAVKRSSETRKRSVPVFETAAIMLALKALAGPVGDGGLADRRPGAQVRPAVWSDLSPDSSAHRISARSLRARRSISG